VVTLAHLVQAERRRAATLGAPPARTRYAALLERWAPRAAAPGAVSIAG
jgi:hypothetical protein